MPLNFSDDFALLAPCLNYTESVECELPGILEPLAQETALMKLWDEGGSRIPLLLFARAEQVCFEKRFNDHRNAH
jgi:hypothetical protein